MRALLSGLIALAVIYPQANAANWTVDLSQSQVAFAVGVNGQEVRGRFDNWTSAISFDENNLSAAKVRIVFDLNQTATGDLSRDKALKSQPWFDVTGIGHTSTIAAANEAVFETDSVQSTGEGAYNAKGILYMRGVSRPIDLDFTLKVVGDTAFMKSTLSIDRTQWGIGQGEYSDETPVSARVDVTVDLVASRK